MSAKQPRAAAPAAALPGTSPAEETAATAAPSNAGLHSRGGDGMRNSPALRYYGSLEGHWSGELRFEVTDWRGGGKGAGSVKLMAALSRLVGPARIATTLAAEGDGFLHTTRVTKWGTTLVETSELILPAEDGRSFVMRGEQRALGARPESYEATGTIADDAGGATYRIPWAGVEMIQRTRIVTEGLELEQVTPFSRARVLLRRAT